MATAADISAQIIANLALTEPDLDTSIGSIARKIIDAVSGPSAEILNDSQLAQYQYDIDSMTSGTLEGFVRLFGMNRRQAQFAVGTVTFSRSASTAALQVATIPIGTQVMANLSPVVYVQTTQSVVMALNQLTVDVPVQAMVAGSSGNVASGTLAQLASSVDSVSSSTTNLNALTGGQDAESDEDLRARWKATAFRNLAGTDQMYRATALDASQTTTAVNVLGAKKTWTDRITITGGTSGAISFGNPAYIYSSGIVVGPSIGEQNLYATPTNYTVTINNTASPATITVNAVSGAMADGDYDIQFDYVPSYSRNDPIAVRWPTGVAVSNRIDLWVNGSNPLTATQACIFSTAAALTFNNTVGSPMQASLFVKPNGTAPAVGDFFIPLAFVPVITVPASLTIGSSTYTLGTHYNLVHRNDAFGYSPISLAGLVWDHTQAMPTNNAAFSLQYNYEFTPTLIQQVLETQWRLVGTDLMVHAGIAQNYRFHLAVVYTRDADPSTVNTAIETALSNLVAPLGFDSALQVSDVLQAVHNVTGVDNVRFLNSGDDATNYAMQLIYPDGSTGPVSQIGGRAADLYFDDAHYPQVDSVRIITKTRSNFGAS